MPSTTSLHTAVANVLTKTLLPEVDIPEVYRPINAVDGQNNAPIQFPRSGHHSLTHDLAKSALVVEGKFRGQHTTPAPACGGTATIKPWLATASDFGPVNVMGHALLKSVDVALNGSCKISSGPAKKSTSEGLHLYLVQPQKGMPGNKHTPWPVVEEQPGQTASPQIHHPEHGPQKPWTESIRLWRYATSFSSVSPLFQMREVLVQG